MSDSSSAGRRSRLLRRALLLGLVALLLFELAIRWLLFAAPSAMAAVGARLQHAELFAAPWEDDYWKLRYLFRDAARAHRPPSHPLLGWHTAEVDPDDLEHRAHGALAGRRPILLYGDSFAACVTPAAECWQGLIEASPYGMSFALLNYGTGGYGLDQTYLMARESLPRYLPERPLVVIGILIDDDLDRTGLRMRGWPKPYLVPAADGGLQLDEPVAPDEEHFLGEHPLSIRSFAWRYLLCGSGLLPAWLENRFTGRREALERTRYCSRLILEALAQELRASGSEHFVILFHGPPASGSPLGRRQHAGWRESFLVRELERLGLPYVLSSVELAASGEPGLFVEDASARRGHYTAAGNRAVFGTLVRGIEGQFDTTERSASAR
ncbi:MAG: hypothetical protein ACI8QZ_002485 [Chlamydiales bacterium]